MHVGVVRTLPSSSRTEIFPSQATMCPRSYIQRPAIQISRRCCSSLFAWPDESESEVTGALLPGTECFSEPFRLNWSGYTPQGSYGMTHAHPHKSGRAKKKLIQLASRS